MKKFKVIRKIAGKNGGCLIQIAIEGVAIEGVATMGKVYWVNMAQDFPKTEGSINLDDFTATVKSKEVTDEESGEIITKTFTVLEAK